MKPILSEKKISFAIPLTLILMLILVVALTVQVFFIVVPLRRDLRSTQETDFTLITQSMAEAVNLEFYGNERLIRTVADSLESHLSENKGSPVYFQQTVDSLKSNHSTFLTAFLLDEKGDVIASSNDALTGKNLSERVYFQAILTNRLDSYTTPIALVSASTGKTTIIHAASVKIDGEIKYVLGTSYDLDIFSTEHILNKELGETGEIFVFDREGTMLIHPDGERRFSHVSDLDQTFSEIMREEKVAHYGSFFYDGTEKRGSLLRIPHTGWYVCAIMDIEETEAPALHIRRIFIISNTVTILCIILLVTLYMHRNLVCKVRKLEVLVTQASRGELQERGQISGRDEIAGMAELINNHLDSLSLFFTSLAGNLGDLDNVGNDLSTNMEETAAALTQIRTNVDNTMKQIEDQENNVASTASAVEETERSIKSLENNIEKQNANIEEGTAAVEEMVAQINNVTSSTGDAEKIMDNLSYSTREGQQKLSDVSLVINDISDKSQELENANSLISGIAAQTNLLAMNAAIEAAHAGDAGKGFAVVADEIRKLAEQSARQSTQVHQSISDINSRIGEAVTGSDQSTRSFEEIRIHMEDMLQITREIRASMEEQASGGAQVLHSFDELKQSGMEVQAGAGEMTQGNGVILTAVQNLISICDGVTMAMREINNGMNEINNAAEEISGLTHKNKVRIEEVREQAAVYKVS